MIEKIKELRVKIDGLAQLVKQLKRQSFIVDLAKIPDDKSVEEFIRDWSKQSHEFIPVEQSDKSPSVQILEQHEVSKSYDSLILAKAWLGKILGELGNPTPYQNDGKRTDVKSIEPTAERAYFDNQIPPKVENEEIVERNHIEKVDWLRQEIQKLLPELPNYNEWAVTQIDEITQSVDWDTDKNKGMEEYEKRTSELPNFGIESDFVYKHLSEARFWLGFELQRIREEQTK